MRQLHVFIPDRGTLEGQREKKDIKAVLDDPLLQFSGQCCSEYSDMYCIYSVKYVLMVNHCVCVTSYKAFSKLY